MSTSPQAGPRVQIIFVRRLETSMVSKMFENLILEESVPWFCLDESAMCAFNFGFGVRNSIIHFPIESSCFT